MMNAKEKEEDKKKEQARAGGGKGALIGCMMRSNGVGGCRKGGTHLHPL
jgi:hypothetical protein